MKIKMLTLAAGPAGIRQAGAVVEVDDVEGQAYVDGGYAEVIEAPTKAVATDAPKGKKGAAAKDPA